MNQGLVGYSVKGQVIDIGGGVNPSYFKFIHKDPETTITTLDLNPDSVGVKIDLETDPLPYPAGRVDGVLMFNILEHIFNHSFVVREAYRVLRPGGELLGFVPFLINYHPDPSDYFRYTNEALVKIFKLAGFSKIEIKTVGRGPFAVNYNNLMFFFPRFIRVILLPIYWCLDWLFILVRPKVRERYPLGYIFWLKK